LPCYCSFPRGEEHPYSNAWESLASKKNGVYVPPKVEEDKCCVHSMME
jgi:hypothetical protein